MYACARMFVAVGLMFLATTARAEDKHAVLKVWPGQAPGEQGDIGPERVLEPRGSKPVHRITDVTQPTITVYPAPAENNTGAAVLICPGGGYSILAWDLEGTEVAQWLNSIGVTGFVLKYRVPRREGREKHEAPLQDAQRAMSIVRSRASQWNVDSSRIGILGFSAGGHLSAAASTNFDRRAYEQIDATDKSSCRPDFAVLIYPAYLAEEGKLLPEIRAGEKTPPTFFAHAGDDRISAANSAQMYLALKQAKVPAELHIYASGGHGFGLRPTNKPCSRWPQQCEAWFKDQGLLKRSSSRSSRPKGRTSTSLNTSLTMH